MLDPFLGKGEDSFCEEAEADLKVYLIALGSGALSRNLGCFKGLKCLVSLYPQVS